ncbi:MAG: type II toxin-antitoxin system VapC family toxin [Chloroflexi bacterium]|nr:type II toxin-antitoxin system VapC family toxin [Chloroflexota bacterium]
MSDSLPRISVDTNVVSAIVRENEYGASYLQLLDGFTPALTYFVRGELAAARWNRPRQTRLDALLAEYRYLPDPNERTIEAFVRATAAATSLGFGAAIGTDLWILAQTNALGLPLMSHDSNAIRTAERAGIAYFTLNRRALAQIEQDRAAFT